MLLSREIDRRAVDNNKKVVERKKACMHMMVMCYGSGTKG